MNSTKKLLKTMQLITNNNKQIIKHYWVEIVLFFCIPLGWIMSYIFNEILWENDNIFISLIYTFVNVFIATLINSFISNCKLLDFKRLLPFRLDFLIFVFIENKHLSLGKLKRWKHSNVKYYIYFNYWFFNAKMLNTYAYAITFLAILLNIQFKVIICVWIICYLLLINSVILYKFFVNVLLEEFENHFLESKSRLEYLIYYNFIESALLFHEVNDYEQAYYIYAWIFRNIYNQYNVMPKQFFFDYVEEECIGVELTSDEKEVNKLYKIYLQMKRNY